MLLLTVVYWSVLVTVESAEMVLTINSADGESHLLEGYAAHEEFYKELQRSIENKVLTGTKTFLGYSKMDIGQLLPNMFPHEYAFLQILHSLAISDSAMTSLQLEVFSNIISDMNIPNSWYRGLKPQALMSEWLRSNLNYPSNRIYSIIKAVVSAKRIGLKIIPQPIVTEISHIMNISSVFMEAVKSGDINVTKWLLKVNPNFDLGNSLETAWFQNRNDIVKLIINTRGISSTIKNMTVNSKNNKNETLLHLTAECKSPNSVLKLIQLGAFINALDANQHSPLYNAVKNNDIEITKILIEKGAHVNLETTSGNIALHAATKNGNADICRMLIESGSKINKKNKYGLTPLLISEKIAISGIIDYLLHNTISLFNDNDQDLILYSMHFEAEAFENHTQMDMEYLKNHSIIIKNLKMRGGIGSIPESLKSKLLLITMKEGIKSLPQFLINMGAHINTQDHKMKEIIFSAVNKGNLEIVTLMLNEGMTANTKDEKGKTLIHAAASVGSTDIFYLLLKRGADATAVTESGKSVLHAACEGGQLAIVRYLIDKGLNVNIKDRDRKTPLYEAALSASESVVNFLIDKGANINATTVNDYTPLHAAALANSVKVVNILIDKGANIEARTNTGRSPMMTAAEEGKDEVVRALLDRGAKTDWFTFGAETVLHLAVKKHQVKVVRTLLDRGMDVNFPNAFGRTPLHIAAENNDKKMAELLLERGARVVVQNEDGNSALHRAVMANSLEIIQLLLDRGHNVNIRNHQGTTPLDDAAKKCLKPIIKYLIQRGGVTSSPINPECIV